MMVMFLNVGIMIPYNVKAFLPPTASSSYRRQGRDNTHNKLYYNPNPDYPFDRIDVSSIISQQSSSSSNSKKNTKNQGDDVKTDSNDNNDRRIMDWLTNLKELERSEPTWITGDDILDISHSMLIQEHFESMYYGSDCPKLFNCGKEFAKAKFDFDWRCIFLKSMPELTEVLETGRCNTHPLRLQLVAIPPNTSLPLHVHATGEIDLPLIGELWEHGSNVRLDKDDLCRQPHHSIGTPLSDFASKPTPTELEMIKQDLADRIVLEDNGPEEGKFHNQRIVAGECLVNQIGSVHQSYTKDQPCLLWCLGANVHGHFRPGNFHQRDGIEELTGIENLVE